MVTVYFCVLKCLRFWKTGEVHNIKIHVDIFFIILQFACINVHRFFSDSEIFKHEISIVITVRVI